MQNTCCAYIAAHRPRRLATAAPAIFAVSAALFAALLIALFAPEPACAVDYTMPRVDIAAEVTSAGDLHVVEKRQLDFSGDCPSLAWTLEGFPPNAYVTVNGVSLQQGTPDTVGAAEPHAIAGVPFQSRWEAGDGPGFEAYSWDGADSSLHVFFDPADTSLIVTLDYTVVNIVEVYKDVGELNWRYVDAAWKAPSADVTATIGLPAHFSQAIRPGDNVRAWGHGPLDGSVSFSDEGDIVYAAARVEPGQYAEAHIVFPVDWVADARDTSRRLHDNESRLEAVLSDEQMWADTANAQRVQFFSFVGFWFAASLALIAVALIQFLRRGRDPKPAFDGDYWHEPPDPELPPAVIGRLITWNRHDVAQFIATLADMGERGIVDIERVPRQGEDGKHSAAPCDYRITPTCTDAECGQLSPLEREALAVVLDAGGDAAASTLLSDIAAGGGGDDDADGRLARWHGLLDAEVEKAGLFDAKSDSARTALLVADGLFFLVAVIAALVSKWALVLVPVIPACLVTLVITRFMRRRTQRGAEVAAKAEALGHWLGGDDGPREEPFAGGERGPLAAYAIVLGLRGKVIERG